MNSADPSYGRCPCYGTYQPRWVEVRMNATGGNVVLTGVGQGACPQCGSRVYKAEVLEILEGLFRKVNTAPGGEPTA